MVKIGPHYLALRRALGEPFTAQDQEVSRLRRPQAPGVVVCRARYAAASARRATSSLERMLET
jgi:hypothetical protein